MQLSLGFALLLALDVRVPRQALLAAKVCRQIDRFGPEDPVEGVGFQGLGVRKTGWSPKHWVQMADVFPGLPKPERGYKKKNDGIKNRNEGTFPLEKCLFRRSSSPFCLFCYSFNLFLCGLVFSSVPLRGVVCLLAWWNEDTC